MPKVKKITCSLTTSAAKRIFLIDDAEKTREMKENAITAATFKEEAAVDRERVHYPKKTKKTWQ